MGKFTLTHEINCNLETFWKLFLNKTFNEELYRKDLGFPEFTITEQVETATEMARLTIPVDEQRCPTCRTKIVVPSEEGLVIKNAILRVSAASGQASAKCPRCKTWVEVPLTYRV